MLVRKCDNCKKKIKQLNEAIVAGIGFPEFSFCERCGKPIVVFLKKRKLLHASMAGQSAASRTSFQTAAP